jgi:predicted flap endonuclease-1-like 5' DNA nuclease
LAEVEAERDAETARLRNELEQARRDAETARGELAVARDELEQARGELEQARSRASFDSASPAPARASSKVPQGLRRIRGIGPAYQRVLEQAGITRVQQIATWTDADVLAFADKLKIRPDRITKDAWITQAQRLAPDPEE